MCYYECFKYACQDWKWGNFREHCHKEYRLGETCGMKLIGATTQLQDKCQHCERIEKKMRRREKASADWQRWAQEPHKYRASMEKAREDMETLSQEITNLMAEKDRRYAQIGNSRRA